MTQAGISNVDTVLIGGRLVKRGGQLLFANIAEKKAALQRSGERILLDFGELPRAASHMIPKSGEPALKVPRNIRLYATPEVSRNASRDRVKL